MGSHVAPGGIAPLRVAAAVLLVSVCGAVADDTDAVVDSTGAPAADAREWGVDGTTDR